MSPCIFQHIPERLHWNGKPVIEIFYPNEELYWRVEENKKINEPPYNYFKDKTLAEISINRSGKDKTISFPDDVLFCADGNQTHYNGHCVVIFFILSIEATSFNETLGELSLKMNLVHNPLDCNYSHSLFRFSLNNVVVTWENYNDTLNISSGTNKKDSKNLRKAARDHLSKLIIGNKN